MNKYNYRVEYSPDDDEFVGLCVEFPSLSFLDKDEQLAVVGIKKLVKDTILELDAFGAKIPEPIEVAPTLKEIFDEFRHTFNKDDPWMGGVYSLRIQGSDCFRNY